MSAERIVRLDIKDAKKEDPAETKLLGLDQALPLGELSDFGAIGFFQTEAGAMLVMRTTEKIALVDQKGKQLKKINADKDFLQAIAENTVSIRSLKSGREIKISLSEDSPGLTSVGAVPVGPKPTLSTEIMLEIPKQNPF